MEGGRGRGMSNLPAWMSKGITATTSDGPQPASSSNAPNTDTPSSSSPLPSSSSSIPPSQTEQPRVEAEAAPVNDKPYFTPPVVVAPSAPGSSSAPPFARGPMPGPMPGMMPQSMPGFGRGGPMPGMMPHPMGQPMMAHGMHTPHMFMPPMHPMSLPGQVPYGAPYHTPQQQPAQQPAPAQTQQQPAPAQTQQKQPVAPLRTVSTNEADQWKEYKDASGRAYYHDLRTNKTTYEKPDCLKSSTEKVLAPCKWKEYQTADGKKYYYDGVNSVWTEPAELTEYKAKLAANEKATSATGQSNEATSTAGAAGSSVSETAVVETDSSNSKSRKKVAAVAAAPLVFNSEEEKVECFVGMLRDYEISSKQRWGDVQRICGEDHRWSVLKTGQKKQIFSEYQAKRLKEEKEEIRKKTRAARDSFMKILATDTEIGISCRWREAQARLANNDAYHALDKEVLDVREQEEMFLEFVTELARKDQEEKRANRKKGIRAFSELLDELGDKITHSSRWLDFRDRLEESGDDRYHAIEENERRNVFSDRVAVLKREYDQMMKEKERLKKAEEKERRDEFRQFLMSKVEEGSITATSHWIQLDYEKEATYIALADQRSSVPREIFDGVVDQLHQAYRNDRKYLRDLLVSSGFRMQHDSTYDELVEILLHEEKTAMNSLADEKEGKSEPETCKVSGMLKGGSSSHARIFFDEMISKEIASHEEKMRRKKKILNRYLDLLEDYYYRSDHIEVTWEDAQNEMRKRSAYQDMDEEDRKHHFLKHIESLAEKMGKTKVPMAGAEETLETKKEVEDGEEEDRDVHKLKKEHKKAKKSKKRSSRSSSDSDSDSDEGDSHKKSKKHKKSKRD